MDSTIREEILKEAAIDLLSVPPLISGEIRRKLIKMTLADIDVDVTPLNSEILRLLQEERKLHVAEIGEKLHVAKAGLTRLIDKLADLNMIERKTDMDDRRTINITLTSQGRAFLELHKETLLHTAMETISHLTYEELEDPANTLKKLRDMLSK